MAPFTVALATNVYPECINYKAKILEPIVTSVYGFAQIIFIFCAARACQNPVVYCFTWLLLLFDCFILVYVSYFQPLWLFIMLVFKTLIEIVVLCTEAMKARNNS